LNFLEASVSETASLLRGTALILTFHLISMNQMRTGQIVRLFTIERSAVILAQGLLLKKRTDLQTELQLSQKVDLL